MSRDELLTKLATELTEWPREAWGKRAWREVRNAVPEATGINFFEDGPASIDAGGYEFTGLEWMQRREEIAAENAKVDQAAKADPVNHPSHYQSEDGIECIDAIRAALGLEGFVAHCRGTAIKYAWRAGSKGDAAECLRKGAWYLTRAAEELEK